LDPHFIRYPETTPPDEPLDAVGRTLEGDDEMAGRVCEDVEYERLADGDPSSESDDVTFCPYDAGGDETTGGCDCDSERLPAPGIGIGGVGTDWTVDVAINVSRASWMALIQLCTSSWVLACR